MRALAAVLLVAVLAGCLGAALPPATAPELKIVERPGNNTLLVTLRNTGESDLMVSLSGFRVTDGDGIVHTPDLLETTQFFGADAFPNLLTIGPHEAARGWLSFGSASGGPPFVLKYDYAGAKASIPIVIPTPTSPPSVESVSPTPSTPATMANDTPPASVGEWINGTEIRARLISIDRTDFTNATFEVEYLNATPRGFEVRGSVDPTITYSWTGTKATVNLPSRSEPASGAKYELRVYRVANEADPKVSDGFIGAPLETLTWVV